jgi:glycosyltransferase involved in cell wall biosynthesis
VNYYSRKFEKTLRHLLDKEEFNIVQIGFIHMAQYIKLIPREIPVIIDTHNAEHLIMHRYCEAEENLLKKVYLRYQMEKLKRYEKKMCKKFDRCLTVSESDKSELISVCGKKASFSLIPNGVDIDYYTPIILSTREAYCTDLIYHGTMSGHMNVDAIIYFYEKILPHIRTEIPDVKLTIAGANPDKKLLNLANIDKNIVVTGAVEDMRPYVAGSKVVIVPLRIGGGTRLKILEAMAQEKPVVSTSVGCEGLEVIPDKDIIIANDPKEFADRTVKLLEDEGLRIKIGLNGRKLVEAKYDWRIIVEKLYSLYQEVIKVENSKNYENPFS